MQYIMKPDLEWGLYFAWYAGEAGFGAGVEDYDAVAGTEFLPDGVWHRCCGYACEAVGVNVFVFDGESVVLVCVVGLDRKHQSGGSFFAKDPESFFAQDGVGNGVERPDDCNNGGNAHGSAQEILQRGALDACS